MKLLTGVKIGLFFISVAGIVALFVFNPSLGAIAGCVFAGFYHAIFGRPDVPSNGSPTKQVGDGLKDDQGRVDDLEKREQATQAGLDRQAESLGRASDAIADAESTLADIAKQNPGK